MCYNVFRAKIKMLILMIFAGAFLAILYIAVRETFSQKMFEPKDATVYGKLDLIAVIPEFNQKKDKPNHQ